MTQRLPSAGAPEWRRDVAVAALLAFAVFLPFLPGLLSGRTLFFRDLSLHFFPLRRFVAEGLAHGQVRWWNPYVHEGEPLALPAVGYPPDLLHAVWPDERLFSILLALHLPLGAVGAFALCRTLGTSRTAAAAAGLVYGGGGFALSSVNLYVYCQALGWAPWAVRGLLGASERGPRAWWTGALPVALCASTGGIEVAVQALVAAPLLASGRKRVAATAAVALLGVGLAAGPLCVLGGTMAGSARARGFTTDVVLGHSVHPLTLVQALVSAFHGDPYRIAERWWGQNFFPLGFPYILSLYLGASTLSLAALGAVRGGRNGRRLGLLALAALAVCLGRWVGWGTLVDQVGALHVVRFPTKAFFTVHLAAAVLAALGLDAASRRGRRGWIALAATAGALGLLLVAAPWLPSVAPRAAARFAAGFFHPELAWPQRAEYLRFVLKDAALGGAAALAVAAVAAAAAAGRLRAPLAAAAMAGVMGTDLLRAGAGLNPMVPPQTVAPSQEARALSNAMRAQGGRVFTCDVGTSPAYRTARAARGEQHLVWSLQALADTYTPAFNVPLALPSAYSPDLTMLVPEDRVPREGEGCGRIGELTERLRSAAVAYVVSLDALEDPALTPAAVAAPPRLRPVRVHVYALAAPRPRAQLVAVTVPSGPAPGSVRMSDADGTRLEVDSPVPATLIVRDAVAPGWSAFVGGRPAPIATVEGRYRAVEVPPGHTAVAFRYSPPGLGRGLAVTGAALVLLLGMRRYGARETRAGT